MENVENILREMRERDDECGNGWLEHFADRLDAAYKRDIQAMCDAGDIDMRTAMGEVERLREENALLKAADDMESERRYEYGIDYIKPNGNVCSNHHHFDSLQLAERYATPLPDEEVRFVRRAVGEWEEVPNEKH